MVVVASFALNFGFIPQALAEGTAQNAEELAAQSDQSTIRFNIPSQPLESGLVAFSQQADINVVGVTATLKQYVAVDIQGNLTKTEALDILLQGTELGYEIISDTSVSIFTQRPLPEDPEAVNFLQEIIITATGRATNLQKTPIAVSAFDQAKLDFNGITDLGALSYLVPGLEMTNTAPQAATLVQLRGVGTTNITEIADGPVSIHIDGIYSPRSQAAVALLYDVDRIEVLRGPQGTLRGRNSPSGSINVYNQQPLLDCGGWQLLGWLWQL